MAQRDIFESDNLTTISNPLFSSHGGSTTDLADAVTKKYARSASDGNVGGGLKTRRLSDMVRALVLHPRGFHAAAEGAGWPVRAVSAVEDCLRALPAPTLGHPRHSVQAKNLRFTKTARVGRSTGCCVCDKKTKMLTVLSCVGSIKSKPLLFNVVDRSRAEMPINRASYLGQYEIIEGLPRYTQANTTLLTSVLMLVV